VSPILAVCVGRGGQVLPDWACIAGESVLGLVVLANVLVILSRFFPKLQTMDLLGWLKAWYKGE
jgi:hypothetical protein